MDEDTLITPSAPESGLPEKKKRGRKPKNQTAESSDSQTAPKVAKKRGRPKKAKVSEEEVSGMGAQSENPPAESVPEAGNVETPSSNAADTGICHSLPWVNSPLITGRIQYQNGNISCRN